MNHCMGFEKNTIMFLVWPATKIAQTVLLQCSDSGERYRALWRSCLWIKHTTKLHYRKNLFNFETKNNNTATTIIWENRWSKHNTHLRTGHRKFRSLNLRISFMKLKKTCLYIKFVKESQSNWLTHINKADV